MANNPTWGQVLGQGIGTIAGGAIIGSARRKREERQEKKQLAKEKRQAILKQVEASDIYNADTGQTNSFKDRTKVIDFVFNTPNAVMGTNSKGEAIIAGADKKPLNIILKPKMTQANKLAQERLNIQQGQVATKGTETERKNKIQTIKSLLSPDNPDPPDDKVKSQLMRYMTQIGLGEDVSNEQILALFPEPEKKKGIMDLLKGVASAIASPFQSTANAAPTPAQPTQPTQPTAQPGQDTLRKHYEHAVPGILPNGQKGMIYSDDGQTWYDEQGRRLK